MISNLKYFFFVFFLNYYHEIISLFEKILFLNIYKFQLNSETLRRISGITYINLF